MPLTQPCRTCLLPVELCEAVMDALVDADLATDTDLAHHRASQRALCACALTCRVWRIRAQVLLWRYPRISDNRRLPLFTAALRSVSRSAIRAMTFGGDKDGMDLSAHTVNGMLMHDFPNLRLLHFDTVTVRLHPRIVRMRPPFFASVTTLRFVECCFGTIRALLDVVWACPNLSCLELWYCRVEHKALTTDETMRLSAIHGHLAACKKLTCLRLYNPVGWLKVTRVVVSPLSGSIFGSALTELRICISSSDDLNSFLRDSFPALQFLEVISTTFADRDGAPFLHTIATSLARPGGLKTVKLVRSHEMSLDQHRRACQRMVGRGEEPQGGQRPLRDLLSGLEELTMCFNECDTPERCAGYVRSVLPDMDKLLRFEYRHSSSDAWREYVCPRVH